MAARNIRHWTFSASDAYQERQKVAGSLLLVAGVVRLEMHVLSHQQQGTSNLFCALLTKLHIDSCFNASVSPANNVVNP